MHEGEAYYNTPKLFRLAPSLSLERLAQALETAVAAHPHWAHASGRKPTARQ